MPSVPLKLFTKASVIKKKNPSLSGADLMYRHHNYGVGRTIAKRAWMKHSATKDLSDCNWLITRVSPRKRGNFGNSVKAWGILTWKGKLYHNGEERRIHAVNSRGWKLIDDKIVYSKQLFPQLSPNLHAAYLAMQKEAMQKEATQ